jgi:hypothetical protein
MLLRRVDERIGLTRAVAAVFSDARDPACIRHRLRDLLAQRLYGRCCGHEDLNDHDTLRADLLMQTAVGRAEPLACAPKLCRLGNRATRAQAVALHGVRIEQFIASHRTAPGELVLDIDASDVPLRGRQERAEFHAYYDDQHFASPARLVTMKRGLAPCGPCSSRAMTRRGLSQLSAAYSKLP